MGMRITLLLFVMALCATFAAAAHADTWSDMRERFAQDPSVPSLIFVRCRIGLGAELEMLVRDGDRWTSVLRCPAAIGYNGIGKSREGDRRTPRGVFGITTAFGTPPSLDTKLPYIKMTDDLYCCGEGATYDQFVRLSEHPHDCTGERLASYDVYRMAMALDYNRDGAPGAGSAIFIHCKGSSDFTEGCIAVDDVSMKQILSTSEPGTRVCIFEEGPPPLVLLSDVAPDIIQEMRYFTTYNFVGERIRGYEEPVALLTPAAARALRDVSAELMRSGYCIRLFDAYRPRRAVEHFMEWAKDARDQRMKAHFYPRLDKSRILPDGYVAARSGHSRGSTVDVTLFDMAVGRDVDMGSAFDLFDPISHADRKEGLTKEQIAARAILRDAMTRGGFRPLANEWWHFTLKDEPYPKTYFDLPVARSSAGRY